jgi:hypothetical protein
MRTKKAVECCLMLICATIFAWPTPRQFSWAEQVRASGNVVYAPSDELWEHLYKVARNVPEPSNRLAAESGLDWLRKEAKVSFRIFYHYDNKDMRWKIDTLAATAVGTVSNGRVVDGSTFGLGKGKVIHHRRMDVHVKSLVINNEENPPRAGGQIRYEISVVVHKVPPHYQYLGEVLKMPGTLILESKFEVLQPFEIIGTRANFKPPKIDLQFSSMLFRQPQPDNAGGDKQSKPY